MNAITWCVVHTQSFKELLAKQHLLAQGYEVYLPRFKKIRRHARRVEEILTPLFPRYIFVGMDLETTLWRSVNGTRGVSHLLMSQDLPARVPMQIIENLRAQEIEDEIVPITSLDTFINGEKLRILDGIFKDQLATFEGLDDKGRANLLLSFMGREMQMTLPSYAVETA